MDKETYRYTDGRKYKLKDGHSDVQKGRDNIKRLDGRIGKQTNFKLEKGQTDRRTNIQKNR